MKKHIRLFAGMLAAALLLGMAMPAYAAPRQKQAVLNYKDIKIQLDGKQLNPMNEYGERLEPFTIDGTTYLPIRAVGNALGLEVGWDGRTSTVLLTSQQTDVSEIQYAWLAAKYTELLGSLHNLMASYVVDGFGDAGQIEVVSDMFYNDALSVLDALYTSAETSWEKEIYAAVYEQTECMETMLYSYTQYEAGKTLSTTKFFSDASLEQNAHSEVTDLLDDFFMSLN